MGFRLIASALFSHSSPEKCTKRPLLVIIVRGIFFVSSMAFPLHRIVRKKWERVVVRVILKGSRIIGSSRKNKRLISHAHFFLFFLSHQPEITEQKGTDKGEIRVVDNAREGHRKETARGRERDEQS